MGGEHLQEAGDQQGWAGWVRHEQIKEEMMEVEVKVTGKGEKTLTFMTENEEFRKVNVDKFQKLSTMF